MIDKAYEILEHIIYWSWQLFVSWYIPGTNITPASLFLFFALANLTIRFIKRLFTGNFGGSIGRSGGSSPNESDS